MKQYTEIDGVVYFWFAGNDTSGSGGDGASPAADVRLAGAAAGAAPVHSPTPVLLTDAGYPAGAYEVAITASAGNGFAADNTYAVFCTLAIDSQNPTGFIGSFDTKPALANVTQLGDGAQSLTDLKDFADAGYDPGTNKITGTVDMRGTDGVSLVVPDASGTAAGLHGTTDGKVDVVDGIVDRILTATEIEQASVNDASATTTKFITTLTETQDDFWNRAAILFTSGNNAGQMRRIKDYVGSTKEVTIQTPLDAAPSDADTFIIPPIRAFLTPDIEDIADAVLDELTADHVLTGSLSKAIADTLTDTAEIGTAGAGLTDLGGMSTGMKAEVNDEVADVHRVDTVAEPSQGAPPETPTNEQILAYIYFSFRNKNEETATEHAVYDNAGTTKLIKAAMADNGTTLTKDEYASGA